MAENKDLLYWYGRLIKEKDYEFLDSLTYSANIYGEEIYYFDILIAHGDENIKIYDLDDFAEFITDRIKEEL